MSPEGYDPQEVIYGDTYKPKKRTNPPKNQCQSCNAFRYNFHSSTCRCVCHSGVVTSKSVDYMSHEERKALDMSDPKSNNPTIRKNRKVQPKSNNKITKENDMNDLNQTVLAKLPQKLTEFLGSLTGTELHQLEKLDPQLLARVYQAGAVFSIEAFSEISREDKHDAKPV